MLKLQEPADIRKGMLLELRRKGTYDSDGVKTDPIPERFVALVTATGRERAVVDTEVLIGERVARLIYRGAYARSSWHLEDIEDISHLYLGIDTVHCMGVEA